MNLALVAAVVALVAVTTGLGTWVALRALPAEMPAELHRIARLCGSAFGAGLGSVLILAVLVQVAGLDTLRTAALDAVLTAALVGMVAEHAAASRWLRTRWLCTAGAELPAPATPPRFAWLPRVPLALAATATLFAAVLIAVPLVDPALPRWSMLFGLASAGQALGIGVMGRRQLRRAVH